MEEEVDLKTILKELRELKALVREDLELDKDDLVLDEDEVRIEQGIANETKIIEEEERRIEEKTAGIAADLTGLRYVSIDAWKRIIWDACDCKRTKVGEREIGYNCALYGGPCKFEICPKNLAIRNAG
jgi:hypothetical protein